MSSDAPENQHAADKTKKRKKRQRERMRAAWISFVGRIVAQFVGSAASVILGLALIHKYQPDRTAPQAAATAVPQPAAVQQHLVAPRVARAGNARRSVAVLPIDSFSGEPGHDFLAKQLTEVITAAVAGSRSLAVVSRTSATALGRRGRTLPDIAGELGADFVLEGSVAQANGRVRVVVQLIDAGSDEHVWAARYERSSGDPLDVQRELAERIAGEIQAVIAVRQEERTLAGAGVGRGGRPVPPSAIDTDRAPTPAAARPLSGEG